MNYDAFKTLTPGLVVFVVSSLVTAAFPAWPTLALSIVGLLAVCVERGETLLRDISEDKKHDLNMVMLQNQIESLQRDHESVKKIAEETKNMVNAQKLSNSVLPKSMRAGFGGN